MYFLSCPRARKWSVQLLWLCSVAFYETNRAHCIVAFTMRISLWKMNNTFDSFPRVHFELPTFIIFYFPIHRGGADWSGKRRRLSDQETCTASELRGRKNIFVQHYIKSIKVFPIFPFNYGYFLLTQIINKKLIFRHSD